MRLSAATGRAPTGAATFAWPLAVLVAWLSAGCEHREPLHELRGETMGTTWQLLAIAPAVERATLQAEVDAVLADVDRALSTWRADSELSRFNSLPDSGWTPVSPLLHAAVAEALEFSRQTGGAFDPTIAPILRAWGLGADGPTPSAPPDEATIATLRNRVGHELLELRDAPPALRRRVPGVELDVDGIAPGFAVDRIAERLEARGVRRYLIEIGGEVRGLGLSERNRPWRVAIERPQPGRPVPHRVLELDGLAISTSGDYRSPLEIGGQRHSHTFDPRLGRPVRHRLAAVSVVDVSTARADALATALTVMGPQDGLAWAEAHGVAVLFLVPGEDGRLEERSSRAFGRLRSLSSRDGERAE